MNLRSEQFRKSRRKVKIKTKLTAAITTLIVTLAPAVKATIYVDLNSPADGPGTAWSNAFHTIQQGIDAVEHYHELVLVADGIYETGSKTWTGAGSDSRVVLDKDYTTVRSQNGPQACIIKGSGPNGDTAIRCVGIIAKDTTLSGFTLTGGHTTTNSYPGYCGGGIFSELSDKCSIENCIITGNKARYGGSGIYASTNTFLRNCLITDNISDSGIGAVYSGVLDNCTVTANRGLANGGVFISRLNNSIVYGNTANFGSTNWYNAEMSYCCTTPLPTNGTGNISSDPQFIATNNLRLAAASPCIDSGDNASVSNTTDIAGNIRIYDGDRNGTATVDMGCYETIIKNTRYVDLNSPADGPGTSWSNAFHNIQSAISASLDFDTVIVTNGSYSTSGLVIHDSLGSRVAINKQIIVRSVNGPASTIIKGFGGIDGDDARRCAYVGTNAVLTGFTLTEGHTRTTGNQITEQSGGGAWCEASGTVSNCIITANTASHLAGGIYAGKVYDCIISSNSAAYGGGTHKSTIRNSLLSYNAADTDGGAAYNATLYNCTVCSNSADGDGGGTYNTDLNNCIIRGNTASAGNDNWIAGTLNYCCTAPLPAGGSGNITNNPGFSSGSFHLGSSSPCIDSGNNSFVLQSRDLDGSWRILIGKSGGILRVDIGCYEYISSETDSDADVMPDKWEADYGLNPTDPSDATGDPDSDSADNLQEYTAQTDPTDSASYFGINAVSISPNGVTVSFNTSSPYRDYTLMRCTNLQQNIWSAVPGAGPFSGGSQLSNISDTNSPLEQNSFYKIKVAIP